VAGGEGGGGARGRRGDELGGIESERRELRGNVLREVVVGVGRDRRDGDAKFLQEGEHVRGAGA